MNIKKLWTISADQRRAWRPLVSDAGLCYDDRTTKNKKQSPTDQSKRLLFIPFVKTTLDVLNPDACKTPVFTVNRNVLNRVALSLQTIQPVIKSEPLFLKQRLMS